MGYHDDGFFELFVEPVKQLHDLRCGLLVKVSGGFIRNKERRIRHDRPRNRYTLFLSLRYRVNKTSTWYEGVIENISQSGVLFLGPQQLPVNALVEMVFEMPEEISGQKNSNVVCQGRIMRNKPKKEKEPEEGVVGLAASIVDYKFIH